MKILLVEDDEMLGQGIETGLQQYGYETEWVKDGQAALQVTKERPEDFDVVILDLGLPKLSGTKMLRQARADGFAIPVIILTARDGIEDRVNGLDTGADDYLIKPFDLDELCARIRALKRRGKTNSASKKDSSTIIYRNIELDTAAHLVRVDGEVINLPRREFSLLLKLMDNIGQVMSRDQLMQSLYGWNEEVDSNTLEVHIHNLRKKLNADFIRTIRGVGYMIDKET